MSIEYVIAIGYSTTKNLLNEQAEVASISEFLLPHLRPHMEAILGR